MTLPNEVFSVFAITGFLLCLVSCPWEFTAWNTGACLYVFWTGLGCLNAFINSIVWNHNVFNKVPVWCDISSKIILGVSIGIPTASFCICRRIYIISSFKSFTISKAETHRTIILDSLISLGIPVLVMSLHYIVQGHRFDIFEDIGCTPSVHFTWQAYLLISSPPIAIGLASAGYAIMNIRHFYAIRRRLRTEHTQFGFTDAMYVRFVCLSSIEVLCTVPLATFFLMYNAKILGLRYPWISWADTHYNFSRVDIFPASVWHGSVREPALEVNRWLKVLCAFIFFGFFGYTKETRSNCKQFLALIRRLGFRRAQKPYHLPPIQFKPLGNTTSRGSLDSYADVNPSKYSLIGVYYGDEKERFDEESTPIPHHFTDTIATSHSAIQVQDAPIPREPDTRSKHSKSHNFFEDVSFSITSPQNAYIPPTDSNPLAFFVPAAQV